MNNTNNILLSASLSGIIEIFSTHWIDRIKTEMQKQTMEKNKKISIVETSKLIYNNGGLKNFYAGLVPRLLGVLPMRLVYWTSMTKSQQLLSDKPKHIKYLFSGIIVGSCQTIIDNPIEVMKIKLMFDKTKILSHLKYSYVGFNPCIIRNVIFATCVGTTINETPNTHTLISGGIGGIIGSILSQPFDVIKTEMQKHKSYNQKTFSYLYKEFTKNPSNLWTGLSMRCLLSCFAMSIGFYSFTTFQSLLK